MNRFTLTLSGAALDFAVMRSLYPNNPLEFFTKMREPRHTMWTRFNYSTSHEHGGPIVEQLVAAGFTIERAGIVNGTVLFAVRSDFFSAIGPTVLIAAMRAFVRHTLGDTIDIPDELLSK